MKENHTAKSEQRDILIRFENVGKIYRTGQIVYEALRDVNLEIMEGELAVILGPVQEKVRC